MLTIRLLNLILAGRLIVDNSNRHIADLLYGIIDNSIIFYTRTKQRISFLLQDIQQALQLIPR